jgi:hypothetical protein
MGRNTNHSCTVLRSRMHGAIPPHTHTTSWRGTHLSAAITLSRSETAVSSIIDLQLLRVPAM